MISLDRSVKKFRSKPLKLLTIYTVTGIKCLNCGNVFTAIHLKGDNPYFTCPECGMDETEIPEY